MTNKTPVVLIEGQSTYRFTIKDWIERNQYHVIATYPTVDQALEKMPTLETLPDIIICDDCLQRPSLPSPGSSRGEKVERPPMSIKKGLDFLEEHNNSGFGWVFMSADRGAGYPKVTAAQLAAVNSDAQFWDKTSLDVRTGDAKIHTLASALAAAKIHANKPENQEKREALAQQHAKNRGIESPAAQIG